MVHLSYPGLTTLVFFMLMHCGAIPVTGRGASNRGNVHTVNVLCHLCEVLVFQASQIIQGDLTLYMTFYFLPVELVTVITNCSGKI